MEGQERSWGGEDNSNYERSKRSGSPSRGGSRSPKRRAFGGEEEKEYWLPKEVWVGVASRLGEAREVLKFGSVCKTWREISKEPWLWRGLIEARWPRIASIDGLLDMRRKGGAGTVGRADELVELYQDLHREALFLPQPLKGGSSRRLNFFKGKGPKKLELAWSYATSEPDVKIDAVVPFEDSVFLLTRDNPRMICSGEAWVLILDSHTGSLRAAYAMKNPSTTIEGYQRSIGISEKHRLLVVFTTNLIQACQLDALSPTSSSGERRKLPAVWTVRTNDADAYSMAVVDAHSRVYLLIAPAHGSFDLCAVSLASSDREVTDSRDTISAIGTRIEWYYRVSTKLSSGWFSVTVEDDVLACLTNGITVIGPLSQCTEVDSAPKVTRWDLHDPRATVIINGKVISRNESLLQVHSLEGDLLFQTNSANFSPPLGFFHPEENIELVISRRGPDFRLVKRRVDVEVTGDPLIDWLTFDLRSRTPLEK